MGSYEHLNVLDESLLGLPGSNCQLSVGTVEDDLGNSFGVDRDVDTGLFDELGNSLGVDRGVDTGLFHENSDCEGCENAVLEQSLCSEMAPQLFNCNMHTADQLVLEAPSCSDVFGSLSNSNVDITDQTGGLYSPSRNDSIATVKSGIDQESPVVDRDGLEDEHGNMVHSFEGQMPQMEFGDSGFCTKEGDRDDQLCCLGSTKVSYLEKEGTQSEQNLGNLAQNGEMPVLSSPLTSSPSKCSQQNEQKDTGSVFCPSEEAVTKSQGVAEEKFNVLEETVSGTMIQPSHIEETSCNVVGGAPNIASDPAIEESSSLQPSLLFGVADISSSKHLAMPDNWEQDVLSVAPTCSVVVDSTGKADKEETGTDSQGVAEEKSDALVGLLTDPMAQQSQIEETSCNLAGGDPSIASVSAIEESASLQASQLFGVMDFSSSNNTTMLDHGEQDALSVAPTCSGIVDSTGQADNEETVTNSQGVPEEKSDVLAGIMTDLMTQTSHIEEISCNLMGRATSIASDSCIEESASLQLSQLFGVVDISSSEHLTMPDHREQDALSVASTYSGVVDSTGWADNEGKRKFKIDFVSKSTCSDIIRSSPRRSTRRSKSIQMTETRKTVRQSGRKASNMFPGGSIGISSKIARGKRSCPCKRARFSIWGDLGNIIHVFEQNDGTMKHDSQLVQVQNKRSRKAKGGLGGERQRKNRAGGSSRMSRGKHRTSTTCIRLKVKMGGEGGPRNLGAMPPEVVDSPASAQTVSGCVLTSDCKIALEISNLSNDVDNKLGENVHDVRQYKYLNLDLKNSVISSDVSNHDAHHGEKDFGSTVTEETSVGNILGDCPGVSSQIGTKTVGEAVDNQYLDPGTSPDSEVINLIHDVDIGTRVQEDLHDAAMTYAEVVVAPVDAVISNMQRMSTKKGKKKVKVKGSTYPSDRNFAVEKKMIGPANLSKDRKSAKRRPGQKVRDDLKSIDTFISANSRNTSSNSSSIEGHPVEPISKVETGTGTCTNSGQDVGMKPSESGTTEGLLLAEKAKGRKLPKSLKSNVGVTKHRSRAPDSASRRRGIPRDQKEAIRKSVNKRKVERGISGLVVNKGENHPETGAGTDSCSGTRMDSAPRGPTELNRKDIFNDPGQSNCGNKFASEGVFNSAMVSNGSDAQLLCPRKAWVRCDDCHKWRCISVALADSIEETNCKWTCKDNEDEAFADCSVPQGKTNAEINAELEISDGSCEEDAYDVHPSSKGSEWRQLTVSQQASWTLIKSNLFLHRSRKTQTIDEIMVCHCKPALKGRLGCGDECLNRMLNIECVRGTCPCGDLCSNQQFQKRKYANLNWFRCGKKGYGLQLLEDVSQGEFLIEYVGEVLELHAYEARQREYASRGQKHFYFMTLNGSEIIDACAKGNLGRFINHSCDPNCRTEKWMVNGEVCIGLFAVRDIKKGEEVTFDYNYVRVFGAAAKKCFCGSSECRGYIGGDPLNTEAVVQGDSDEEYPEPVMVHEHGGREDRMDRIISNTSLVDVAAVQHAEFSLQTTNTINKSATSTGLLKISLEKEDTMSRSVSADVQPSEISIQTEDPMSKFLSAVKPLEICLQRENIMSKSLSTIQPIETSSLMANSMSKSLSDSVESNSKSTSDKPNVLKSYPLVKSSRLSSAVKKGKCGFYPVVANKAQVGANKPKKLLEGAASGRFEGVEEKLNELLDADGGISKRKDATKGYLKLLVLTAASGDNVNGQAVQSTRDLSMILDALLKTKSRMVLADIINKNGLQMLHNIMKQNQRNFNKTPVIRKLLKVLEFLALREILTVEHINRDPPCSGMESFKESIINLTRHNDVKVQQIAWDFRDKWIPRPVRRFGYSERDDSKLEIQSGRNCNRYSASHKSWHDQGVRPTEAINCVSRAVPPDAAIGQGSSTPFSDGCPANGSKTRKRKSRWDQPAVTDPDPQPPQHIEDQMMEPSVKQKLEPTPKRPEISEVVQEQVAKVNREEKICNDDHSLSPQTEAAASIDVMQNIHEDAPPGFPSLNSLPVPSNTSTSTTVNLTLQKVHDSSCAYEVMMGHPQGRYLPYLPVSYGIPVPLLQQLGTPQEETVDSWVIAPGMPFHPFPPLPPFPRDGSNPLRPSSASNSMMMNGPKEEAQLASHLAASHHADSNIPSTAGARPPDMAATEANNQQTVEQVRCSSDNLGRRYFRQQKCNNSRYRPPWLWKKSGCGFKGSNSRSGVYSVGFGNGANEVRDLCSEGVSGGGKDTSCTLYQQPQHQYQH